VAEIRIAVVGAGVIGLAVSYHLAKAGARVTVIDGGPEKDGASFGNAGAIAVTELYPAASPGVWWRVFGWLADPLGPLAIRPKHAPKLIPWLIRFARSASPRALERISDALAALNARVYEDLKPMLGDCGLLTQLHTEGALTLYETEAGYTRDAAEWACKRAHGIIVQELSGDEARRMEGALGPNVHRAVFTPQWSCIEDPRRLMEGLRDWLLRNGVVIVRGKARNVAPGVTSPASVELENGATVAASQAVIAAGAWSGILARRLGDRVLLESERGYTTTLPSPGIAIGRELIFAERKFVATPLSCGLRIGGAAEFGGLAATANFQRSRALVKLARLYLPDLRTEGGIEWAGHRPTTPDSLPVIGPSVRRPNVFYAFGHGHLGLTQAATTGRLVCDQILGRKPVIDTTPFSIGRFGAPREIRNGTLHFLLH
jgi:D-amino-acid dehydrogenase